MCQLWNMLNTVLCVAVTLCTEHKTVTIQSNLRTTFGHILALLSQYWPPTVLNFPNLCEFFSSPFYNKQNQILRTPVLLHLLAIRGTSTTHQTRSECVLFVLNQLILSSQLSLSLIPNGQGVALDRQPFLDISLTMATFYVNCCSFMLRECH